LLGWWGITFDKSELVKKGIVFLFYNSFAFLRSTTFWILPVERNFEIRKLDVKRKKSRVVIGEFKKLALAKKLVSQRLMSKIVKKELYDPYKNTWN